MNCFSFRDFNIGFASALNNGPAADGMYGTTDGGVTWKNLPGAPNECNGCYYNILTNRLFAARKHE